MATMFDTSRLSVGDAEVKEIYELADLIGVDVIKLTYGTNGGHQSTMIGFEVGKFADGTNEAHAVVDGGHLHFYPDKRLTKWGFMLDTEANMKLCAACFADNTFNIADQKYRDKVEKYCIENGIRTTPVVTADPFRLKSVREAKAEDKASDLEFKIKQMQSEMDKMQKEKEEAELKASQLGAYAERNTEVTETIKMYDESTGETVDKEIKAVLPGALEPAPEQKERVSKVGKSLSGVKLNK